MRAAWVVAWHCPKQIRFQPMGFTAGVFSQTPHSNESHRSHTRASFSNCGAAFDSSWRKEIGRIIPTKGRPDRFFYCCT
jgi:hypothetical protein